MTSGVQRDTVLKLKVLRLPAPAPDILGKGPCKREGNGLASTEEKVRYVVEEG